MEITRGLKSTAKDLNIPVLALPQLSRDVEKHEGKHPQFADLCHSGVIEQDTDVVSFMYREDYSLSREEPRHKGKEGNAGFMGRHASWEGRLREVDNMTEVIVAKQRTGPIGVEQLSFKLKLAQFTDL